MHDSITALLLNVFNTEPLLNEIEKQDIELLLRSVTGEGIVSFYNCCIFLIYVSEWS